MNQANYSHHVTADTSQSSNSFKWSASLPDMLTRSNESGQDASTV